MDLFGIDPNKKAMQAQQQQYQDEMDMMRQQVDKQVGVGDQDLIAEAQGRSELIRWQQDLDDELLGIVMRFLGKTKTQEGTWMPDKKLKAICNDRFVSEVLISQTKPFMNRNFINSRFDEDNLRIRLRKTHNAIARAIALNHQQYGIPHDPVVWDLVCRTIKNSIDASAMRALRGWTKIEDNRMTRRIETDDVTKREAMMHQRKGVFGGMFT